MSDDLWDDPRPAWGAPPEPRWGPDVPLAERITRRGRFADIDPSVPGRVWSRWSWLGFLTWLGLTAGSLWRASRREHDRVR